MVAINDILAEAERLASQSKTWADLSNDLCDPLDGLVVRHFPDAVDRAAFRKSDVYGKLHKLVEQKMRETGTRAGAEPLATGPTGEGAEISPPPRRYPPETGNWQLDTGTN